MISEQFSCRSGGTGGLPEGRTTAQSERSQGADLSQYLELYVVNPVMKLKADESMELARRYVAKFDILPGLELESPASIATRWRQIIHQHAHRVLYG